MRALLIAALLLCAGCDSECWTMQALDGRVFLSRSTGHYQSAHIPFATVTEAMAFSRANNLPLCGFPEVAQ